MDTKPVGASHEVMAGTGVLPPADVTSAQHGEGTRLTKAELAILEAAEKAAAKRSKKSEKKVQTLLWQLRLPKCNPSSIGNCISGDDSMMIWCIAYL